MSPSIQDQLLPGDILLYKPSSIFGLAIAFMTGGWISHVEMYKGGGISYASRDGIGVDEYPLRLNGLAEVRRSKKTLNMGAVSACFSHLRGDKYDANSIIKNITFGKWQGEAKAEVCSELVAILVRVAGLKDMFSESEPDEITPRDFQKQGELLAVRI